jgi:thioesterase domain-containing protein
MAQRVGGEALLLNTKGPRAVFAMPPLFGYGAGLRNLAALIHGYSVYGLDFIEETDRIERYVRNIRAVEPHGPYVLLGYSGGGNLAFEIARELERKHCEVSSLILLDAPLRRASVEMSDDGIQSMMEGNLNYFRTRMEASPDYHAFVVSPQMKQLMLRKMEAFIRYLNGLVNTGCIHAHIHLIRSEQRWAAPADWDTWRERTAGALSTYQGAGDHAGMTDGHNAAGNAAIINRILESNAEASEPGRCQIAVPHLQ